MINVLQNNKIFLSEKESLRDNPDKIVKLVTTLNNDRVILVSGMRYAGKTRFISEMITKTRIGDKAFYFNSELDTLWKVKSAQDILSLIKAHTEKYTKPQILILQNISKIAGIKELIWKIYEEKTHKMILVGNNLKIEGIEEIEIHTAEISHFINNQEDLENIIISILSYWSIEEVHRVQDTYMKKFLLESIKTSIISKDIISAYSIKNSFLYNQTLAFLSSIDSYISLREFNRRLAWAEIDVSLITSIDYINFTLNSKLVSRIYRYDLKLRKEITSKAKYYFADTGIRNAAHGVRLSDDTLTENLIYNELIKKGYEIQGGIYGRFEFDFLCTPTWIMKDQDLYLHISKESDRNEIQKQARKLWKAELEMKTKSQETDVDMFAEAPVWTDEDIVTHTPRNVRKVLLVKDLDKVNIRKLNISWVEIVDLYEFMRSF